MHKALPLTLILAAAALGACNKDPEIPSPPIKAGLWQQVILRDGNPIPGFMGHPFGICIDEATSKRAGPFGRMTKRGKCDKFAATRGADGSYVLDTSCTSDQGMKSTSHTVVAGDFNAKYSITSDRTVSGADNDLFNGHHTTTTTATFQGACPDGMKPGQIQTADGQIMDMPRGRAAFGGGGGRGGGGGGGGGGG